jgi:hypothetical protein
MKKVLARIFNGRTSEVLPPETRDVGLRPPGRLATWSEGKRIDSATVLVDKQTDHLHSVNELWTAARTLRETQLSYMDTRRKIDRAPLDFAAQDNEAKKRLVESDEDLAEANHKATLRGLERRKELGDALTKAQAHLKPAASPKQEKQAENGEHDEYMKDAGLG